MPVSGSPDLLAQALDKLIANAVSFAVPGTPVTLSLSTAGDAVWLELENTGARLPAGPPARLFDSMVSIRPDHAAPGEPHLGLGLYVVRLAAQFHHGEAAARNRADGSGVIFTLRMPLAS